MGHAGFRIKIFYQATLAFMPKGIFTLVALALTSLIQLKFLVSYTGGAIPLPTIDLIAAIFFADAFVIPPTIDIACATAT
jgi:hypothetical protein